MTNCQSVPVGVDGTMYAVGTCGTYTPPANKVYVTAYAMNTCGGSPLATYTAEPSVCNPFTNYIAFCPNSSFVTLSPCPGGPAQTIPDNSCYFGNVYSCTSSGATALTVTVFTALATVAAMIALV